MSAMAAAEEASASTISNLAELVRAQRDRQGVESRKAQVIPIVLDNENDSTAESHASED